MTYSSQQLSFDSSLNNFPTPKSICTYYLLYYHVQS